MMFFNLFFLYYLMYNLHEVMTVFKKYLFHNGYCPRLDNVVTIRVCYDPDVPNGRRWLKLYCICNRAAKFNCDRKECPIFKEAGSKQKG